MMRRRSICAAAALFVVLGTMGMLPAAHAAGEGVPPPHENWSFSGLFGTYDRAALQRGFQVYDNICSTCHSLRLLSYRNLEDIGLTEDQVKKIAAAKQVTDGPNDKGEMFQRPGKPSDHFVSPFPNANAASAANNGAVPPDFSLIVKARKGGADYVHALMTGFAPVPPPEKNACRHYEEVEKKTVGPDGKEKIEKVKVLKAPQVRDGQYYNIYFPGCVIAMPPPLSEGAVEYADKTKATVDQMARDVATFLTWASEPKLEQRKRMGVKVILFLLVLTGLLYAIKRKIWSDVH